LPGPEALALLALAAAASSALSAVVGMAGGITLLAVMLLYVEPAVAIPLHGAVQLVSNATRAVVQRRHVAWPVVPRFAALLLPAAFAGLALSSALPPAAARLAIGIFVLIATWRPGWLAAPAASGDPLRRMVAVGGAVGFLSTTIGATGPLMAPFFLHLDLTRQSLVGTKAVCQALGHLAKLAAFGALGFAFAAWLGPLALLSAAVVAGTWAGSLLLERVDEATFRHLYVGVLTAIALRLVVGELLALH
jgi:uncharacterized membrane protein YfcA